MVFFILNLDFGQLGYDTLEGISPKKLPDLLNNTKISAGSSHSLVLRIDGRVLAFGANSQGQLGLNFSSTFERPKLISNLVNIESISAGGDHSMVKDKDNRVFVFGRNEFGQLGIGSTRSSDYHLPIQLQIDNIKTIYAGPYLSILIDFQGNLYGFGQNNVILKINFYSMDSWESTIIFKI
jgi:alpha-tubulin suppressor-like RCC1 family protein